MADITDPEAIRYCDEVVRPIAEAMRALKARGESATTVWFGGMNTRFPNDDDSPVVDGREAEGVSRLTGRSVNSFMSVLIAADAAINDEITEKPCVRPLDAS